MSPIITRPLALAALAASLPIAAQTAATPPAVQAAPYGSAFDGYRPFQPGEVGDWRQSNDTVRDIGGWRAYAREIQQGAPARAAPAQDTRPAGQAPTDPHRGHSK